MNDNDDWGTPPPIKTNLTGDLQRAFNYGWKSACEHHNKHPEMNDTEKSILKNLGEAVEWSKNQTQNTEKK